MLDCTILSSTVLQFCTKAIDRIEVICVVRLQDSTDSLNGLLVGVWSTCIVVVVVGVDRVMIDVVVLVVVVVIIVVV